MKIIGCILLFISCSLMGYFKAISYKTRVNELENIIEIIKLIEIEITYRKESLKKVFRRVSRSKKCWFSKVLEGCEKQLDSEISFENAWKHSIKCQENCPLNDCDLEVLHDLSLAIGRSDTAGQISAIEPIIIRLNCNLEMAKANNLKLGKMYKGLGIASGATLAILLL